MPRDFTNSVSLPASSASLRSPSTSAVFISSSLPANGTLTVSFADPSCLFIFTPRNWRLLETGVPTAARQAAASTEPMSAASDPGAGGTPGKANQAQGGASLVLGEAVRVPASSTRL